MPQTPSLDVLLAHARAYCSREGIRMSTLSTWLFNDGKVLGRIECGAGMTLKRYNRAMAMMATPGGWSSTFDRSRGPAGGPSRENFPKSVQFLNR